MGDGVKEIKMVPAVELAESAGWTKGDFVSSAAWRKTKEVVGVEDGFVRLRSGKRKATRCMELPSDTRVQYVLPGVQL